MEILTGVPMGTRKDGRFSEGSIGFLVDGTLRGMADKLKYVSPSDAEQTPAEAFLPGIRGSLQSRQRTGRE
jgi:hypothetical protein